MSPPLHEDEVALKGLLHSSDGIVDGALQGIQVKAVEELAQWYLAKADQWAAARLYDACTSILNCSFKVHVRFCS